MSSFSLLLDATQLLSNSYESPEVLILKFCYLCCHVTVINTTGRNPLTTRGVVFSTSRRSEGSVGYTTAHREYFHP